MKTSSEKKFLKWIDDHDMGLDERYPDCAVLIFKPNPHIDRFWKTPSEPERRSYFLSFMLELMGKWEQCFVWRHMGSWPSKPNSQRINDRVEYLILSGIGLPMGTADIVEFDRSETDRLVTLLFSTTVFGWSVGEDLYVVPNDAQFIMKTSHHDVAEIAFRTEQSMMRFVVGMKKEGFTLPDELPDATFKRPDWMTKE